MLQPRSSLLHINIFLLKKFINDYKLAMLAHYLALLGATNLQKSKTKSVKAVNSLRVNKEGTFYFHLSMESFCIVF